MEPAEDEAAAKPRPAQPAPAASDAGSDVLHYDFDASEKLLGLRLSPDYPPLILAVKPDSAGAQKGIPLRGAILAINGRPVLSEEDVKAIGEIVPALKVRPLRLDVRPPPPAAGGDDGAGASRADGKAHKAKVPKPAKSQRPPAAADGAAPGGAAPDSAAAPSGAVEPAAAPSSPAGGPKQASPAPAAKAASSSAPPAAVAPAAAPAAAPVAPAGAATPAGGAEEVDEDYTSDDSSASEPRQQVDRAAADLALLSLASPAGRTAKGVGATVAAAAAGAKAAPTAGDEDSGEDSGGEVAAADVSAERFDRDMDLLHKHYRHDATAGPPQAGGGEEARRKQLSEDEALARLLQEELDSEAVAARARAKAPATAAAPPVMGQKNLRGEEEDDDADDQVAEAAAAEQPLLWGRTGERTAARALAISEDEALARRMQAEFDAEDRGATAAPRPQAVATTTGVQAQASPMVVRAVPVPIMQATASEAKTQEVQATQALSPAAAIRNLLSEPLSKLHPDAVWAQRQKKLATSGVHCMKVGRNGCAYRRTFWLVEGCLRTDGKGTRQVPVAELTGVFRSNRSPEFDKIAANHGKAKTPGLGLIMRSSQPQIPVVRGQVSARNCCVMTTHDRTFSLYFENSDECLEFAETVAWYTLKLTWA